MIQEERFKFFVAVYLMLFKENKILLSKRRNTGFRDGYFGLVAGHLEKRESAKKGIVREAEEEAGIILKEDDLKVVHVMHQCVDLDYIDIYLKAEKWEGEIMNNEPDKCEELRWFKMDELPDNVIPNLKLAIENVNNNVLYDEFNVTKKQEYERN